MYAGWPLSDVHGSRRVAERVAERTADGAALEMIEVAPRSQTRRARALARSGHACTQPRLILFSAERKSVAQQNR